MSSRPTNDFLDEWSLFLRRVPLFHDLEAGDIRQIAGKLQPLSLPKGATVYRENDPADSVYIIQSGRVKAVTYEDNGSEKVLNFLSRGETFGETALITDTLRTATVKVDSPAHFLVLYRKDFEIFLQNNPEVSSYLHRVIGKRLILPAKKSIHPSFAPEVIGFILDLDQEEQLAFLTNMALSLKEQTRRRILVIELGAQGDNMLTALGIRPHTDHPPLRRTDDLINPKVIERSAVLHPASGLEILVVPEDMFFGPLARAIPNFMSILLEIYDFVLLNATAIKSKDSNSDHIGDGAKAILSECDALFYAHKGENLELEKLRGIL